MIIASPDEIAKIQKRQITEIRRFRPKARIKEGATHQVKPSLFGKPACLVDVKSVAEEQLDKITKDGAKAQGYNSPEEYIKKMVELYGKNGLTGASKVWVIKFVLKDDHAALAEAQSTWTESQKARVSAAPKQA